MTYYKVLHEDGSAFHGGHGAWSLPRGSRPGKWMPLIAQLRPCQSGYHVCEPGDLLSWLGPAIFVVEVRGESIRHTDKTVVQQARLLRQTPWNGKLAASFALDCAQHSLNREERAGRTPDKRLYDVIKVSRRFLKNEATSDELSAAESAAGGSWSTAAAWAAESARAAAGGSWSTAAAWAAGGSWSTLVDWSTAAAWAAGGSAEVSWQQKRLVEYLEGKRHV